MKTALRLDVELMKAGKRLKAEEGIPVTVQIEMAWREWLEKRSGALKTGRRRGK